MQVRLIALATLILVGNTLLLFSQQIGAPAHPVSRNVKIPNLPTKTLGGAQFWSDVYFSRGWRIQLNVISGHHRLLDENDVRRSWGAYDECRTAFEAHKDKSSLPKMQSRAVVVLHGLGRSKNAMCKMAAYLAEQESDQCTIVNVSYASGRLGFAEHAANLTSILEGLRADGVQEVSFVAHSMGNLVVRHLLASQTDTRNKPLPRFHRMVMLGPPNQGSQLAVLLKTNPIFKLMTGSSGRQIADLEKWKDQFAIPKFEFAIIAGGRGKEAGRNPAIAGDDDLVVSVEETKLDGASDFLVVPAVHTLIMNHATVQEATLRFLRHGYLTSAASRKPL